MVSFGAPHQVALVAEVCASFCLDNGAYSAWRAGSPVTDWTDYFDWCREWLAHPGCDFAIIPDVIDGSETDNDDLLRLWESRSLPDGVPVWHLHESLGRLRSLLGRWRRVALGSSGEYAEIGTERWWHRMGEAMTVACDGHRRPLGRLHGLRMLAPTILSHIPLASADSTMVARNIGLDTEWRGRYAPRSRGVRASVLIDRIDHHAKASLWSGVHGHQMNLELLG
jgi:hypothetical protein